MYICVYTLVGKEYEKMRTSALKHEVLGSEPWIPPLPDRCSNVRRAPCRSPAENATGAADVDVMWGRRATHRLPWVDGSGFFVVGWTSS